MAPVVASRRQLVPAMPTLWPRMLVAACPTPRFYPFSAPAGHYFYFARIGICVNRPHLYPFPAPEPPPPTSLVSHVMSSLLQNVELRGGAAGRRVRAAVRRLGKRTVDSAGIERVTTGSDHFERENLGLGMSTLSRRIIGAQNLGRIVATRRRNYRLLLDALRDVAPPLFDSLPAGVCPLFYPLIVEDKAPLMERLAAQGIETINFWRFFHPACDAAEFPDVAWLRDHILEIPCHHDLTAGLMAGIARAVRTALIGPAVPSQAEASG